MNPSEAHLPLSITCPTIRSPTLISLGLLGLTSPAAAQPGRSPGLFVGQRIQHMREPLSPFSRLSACISSSLRGSADTSIHTGPSDLESWSLDTTNPDLRLIVSPLSSSPFF